MIDRWRRTYLRTRNRRISVLAGLLSVLTAAVITVTTVVTSAGASAGHDYVALGDSYTSDPGVSANAPGISPSCLQSSADYPHQVGAALGLTTSDVSCSGATSSDMTRSQSSGVAPQFDALSSGTNVVTLGIGGDDNHLFVDALVSCGILDLPDFLNIGAPCKLAFGNKFANALAGDASAIGAVLQGIHARSPGATVFVVGYPDLLPRRGNCYPTMPLTSGDTTYLNGIETDLNAMLSSEAAANHAVFVDTYIPSIGHDACSSAGTRWVNPIIATTGGISVHPTPNGVAETARLVQTALTTKGF